MSNFSRSHPQQMAGLRSKPTPCELESTFFYLCCVWSTKKWPYEGWSAVCSWEHFLEWNLNLHAAGPKERLPCAMSCCPTSAHWIEYHEAETNQRHGAGKSFFHSKKFQITGIFLIVHFMFFREEKKDCEKQGLNWIHQLDHWTTCAALGCIQHNTVQEETKAL